MEELLKKQFMDLLNYELDMYEFRKNVEEVHPLAPGKEATYALSLLLMERLDPISEVEAGQIGIDIFRELELNRKRHNDVEYWNGNIVIYGLEFNPPKRMFEEVVYAIEPAYDLEFLERVERITTRRGDRGLREHNKIHTEKERHLLIDGKKVKCSRDFVTLNNMEGRVIWERSKEDGSSETFNRSDVPTLSESEFEDMRQGLYLSRLFGKQAMRRIDGTYREREKQLAYGFFGDVVRIGVQRSVEATLSSIGSISHKDLREFDVLERAFLTLSLCYVSCKGWQEDAWLVIESLYDSGYSIDVIEMQSITRFFAGVSSCIATISNYLSAVYEEYLDEEEWDFSRQIIYVNDFVIDNREDQIGEGV